METTAETVETREIITILTIIEIMVGMVGILTVIITRGQIIMGAGIHLVPTSNLGVEVRLK